MLYGLLLANGNLDDGPALRGALTHPAPWMVIAVDGGLRHAHALGLTPNLIVGDMDSADPLAVEQAQAYGAEIIRVPAHKDETDLELALILAAQRGCNPIRIVGALGGRLDQTLGNVYLLTLPALRRCDVRLVSRGSTTRLAYPGETVIQGHPGDTISLIPMAKQATGIVTEGLEYPLKQETLMIGPARGISNVMLTDEALVHFDDGLLLIIHTLGRA